MVYSQWLKKGTYIEGCIQSKAARDEQLRLKDKGQNLVALLQEHTKADNQLAVQRMLTSGQE